MAETISIALNEHIDSIDIQDDEVYCYSRKELKHTLTKEEFKELQKMAIEYGVKIIPEETLIIFDEIQENPKAIASLKYFYEKVSPY